MVGPLDDEFDQRELGLREVAAGVFEAPGRVSLPEVLDRLGISLDPEEDEGEDTLGGHVTARLGRFARAGDVVSVGPYRAEILEASSRRIERLCLRRIPAADGAPPRMSDPDAPRDGTEPGDA